MKKILILLLSLHSISIYCMEQRSNTPNRLQEKYPAPVDWHQFEKENLEAYTQKEVLPFLCSAVSNNAPVVIVKKILDEKEINSNARDANGTLLLVHAILAQNTPAVVALINRGAKVAFEMDRPGYTGEYDDYRHELTPWQAACIVGKEKYVRMLLQKMEPQDKQWVIKQPMFNIGKQRPIDYALTHKKTELAQILCAINKYLISEGYDFPRAQNAAGWHDATYLELLYEQIQGMLLADNNKYKLLTCAVCANNVAGVKFLIEHGALPDAPLCARAALQQNKQIFDMICPHVKLNAQFNNSSDLPLRFCLRQTDALRSTEPIEWLLAAGADVHEEDPYDHTQPIHDIACLDTDLALKKSLVQLFRSKGIRLDTPDRAGNTLLHHVCKRDNEDKNKTYEFMFYLLDLGADPNVKNEDEQTPFLLFCSQNRKPTHLRTYIQYYQPALTIQDHFGNTPLIHAAGQGKKAVELITLLQKPGAQMHPSANQMLHRACATLNVALAKMLIEEHGADINHVSNRSKTPLVQVVTADNFAHKKRYKTQKIVQAQLALVDILLTRGALINEQDDEGNTALHHARTAQVTGKLLAHGANPTLFNKHKQTALEQILSSGMYAQNIDRISLLVAHTSQRPIRMSTGQTVVEYVLAESPNAELLELVTRNT